MLFALVSCVDVLGSEERHDLCVGLLAVEDVNHLVLGWGGGLFGWETREGAASTDQNTKVHNPQTTHHAPWARAPGRGRAAESHPRLDVAVVLDEAGHLVRGSSFWRIGVHAEAAEHYDLAGLFEGV